jgi:hypothetical protein
MFILKWVIYASLKKNTKQQNFKNRMPKNQVEFNG